jgi:hypothetical protein
MRNGNTILDGKLKGKRQLGRPRHREEEILEWILGE